MKLFLYYLLLTNFFNKYKKPYKMVSLTGAVAAYKKTVVYKGKFNSIYIELYV